MARSCKRLVLKRNFESDLSRATETLFALLACGPSRDWTIAQVKRALLEYIAALPVYRTYVSSTGTACPSDAAFINEAVRIASQRKGVEQELLCALAEVFLKAPPQTALSHSHSGDAVDLLKRFRTQLQQLTGAVMAKGCEDTAFYRYLRLTALVCLPFVNTIDSYVTLPIERSRWRSRSVWHFARSIPQVSFASLAELARRALLHLNARHEARIGRPPPARCSIGDERRVVPDVTGVGGRECKPQEWRLPSSQRRAVPVSDNSCCMGTWYQRALCDIYRPNRSLHDKGMHSFCQRVCYFNIQSVDAGVKRGEGIHELD